MGSDTGGYTQVIWKATKSFGCGSYENLVDCQYGPVGNVQGEFASNTDRPKYTQATCEMIVCGGSCGDHWHASDPGSVRMLGSSMPVLEADSALMLGSPIPAILAIAASAVGFIVALVLLARRSSTMSPQPLLG